MSDASERGWMLVNECPPPADELVETKIDDVQGERNVQNLRRIGRLWFLPGGHMYVYYQPTHWRRLDR